jgi:hypothetical protein
MIATIGRLAFTSVLITTRKDPHGLMNGRQEQRAAGLRVTKTLDSCPALHLAPSRARLPVSLGQKPWEPRHHQLRLNAALL